MTTPDAGPSWPTDAGTRLARRLLRAFAGLVPWDNRRDWLDEWEAELWQLRHGNGGSWCVGLFLAGALWHGLWECKERWRMEPLIQDLRYALRTLGRSPGFTFAAVLMLGSSIGASTALFSVLEKAILADPPWPDPSRLVVVDQLVGTTPGDMNGTRWSYPRFRALTAEVDAIAEAAGYERRTMTLSEPGTPIVVATEIVTPSLFPMLGVEAARGRVFGPDDEDAGAPHMVALVGDGFWRERMAASPDAVGQLLTLDQLRVEVIGVLPPDFDGLTGDVDVWLPMASLRDFENDSALDDPWNMHFLVLARLASGVSIGVARQQVHAFGATIKERFPAPVGATALLFGADVMTYREARSNPTARASMLALLAAVLLLLLVATANLAALQLARGASRQRDAAVRTALGAARGRLLRQHLTESVVLAALGGALGIAIAWFGVDGLGTWLTDAIGTTGQRAIRFLDPEALVIDWRVVAFATVLTGGVGVGLGLLPAFQAARADPNTSLRGGHTSEGDRGWSLGVTGRSGLIVVQVAVAIVLLSGAMVMLRTMANLQRVDLGFDTERLLTATYALTPSDRIAGIDAGTFHTEFVERVRALPGVTAATAGSIPMSGPIWRAIVLSSEGRPELDPASHTWIRLQPVPDGHLEAMGIGLIEGRSIEQRDDQTVEPVIVLGETAARYLFPSDSAIGRRIRLNWSEFGLGATVIGIARDVGYDQLGGPPGLQGYVSLKQAPRLETGIMVRTVADPASIGFTLRRILAEMKPTAALTSVLPMETRVARLTARPRVVTLLLSLFGAVALLLVGAGLYGTIAFTVARRTRELSVRVSLGATQHALLLLVLRHALTVTVLGVVAGLGGAAWSMHVLDALVFGTEAVDPPTLVGVSIALFAVACAAAYVPARRALQVDPVIALRSD